MPCKWQSMRWNNRKQIYREPKSRDELAIKSFTKAGNDRWSKRQKANTRIPDRDHKSTVPSLPVATKCLHCSLHWLMHDLSFLSPNILPIHNRSAFSSSGTKKEDKSDKTVSKLAALDVMLSARGIVSSETKRHSKKYLGTPKRWLQQRRRKHPDPQARICPTALAVSEMA